MRCEECRGAGFEFRKQFGNNDNAVSYTVMHIKIYPCPSCNGSGITSCCDGAVGNSVDIPGPSNDDIEN
jgi:hypothetical protein